ncbi:hypothetical protein CLPUN_45510 [Clostridium puniceum]|uniref:Uncharacterized protein n=1 Tax=Clostridium puniceum TaxID=29367 RepID=A0A1S8T6Z8_9CLOT|nr:hypothetical protein [Clostridium puniceum]OOM73468.1 hypothetical protein CLPUN_45510 [Clostridium puniceum]
MKNKNIFKGFTTCVVIASLMTTMSFPVLAEPIGPPPDSGNTEITSAAVYVKDNKYISEQSTQAAVSYGTVADTFAKNIKIISDTESSNGLYVTGSKSNYILQNSKIMLSGNGSNDFAGVGAGAMVNGGGTLILKNANITTNGCIRSAVAATDHSILKVYDSTLISNGGTLPSDYQSKIGPGMMEPPEGLEVTGTARTCLTMNNSKSYYYNSTIIADGWGALSTDSAGGYVYLEANKCNIKTIKDGYGAYADNGCHDVFNDCKFNSAAMAVIMAGENDVTFKNTDATCGTYFAMMHCVMGSTSDKGTLNVTGGNIKTSDAAVLVKSDNADIIIDGARIVSKNGTLIKSIINSDPNRTKVPTGETVYGIKATLKNMVLQGNILHEDTERSMSITLMGTTLKGKIKDASIYIDADSKWIATEDSNVVTLAGSFDVSKIDAVNGVTITATASSGCTLKGSYKLASGGTLNVN